MHSHHTWSNTVDAPSNGKTSRIKTGKSAKFEHFLRAMVLPALRQPLADS